MLEKIADAIEKIHEKEDEKFCASLAVPFEKLQLELKGVRSFQFPLNAEQMTSLINHASPAHFGRRDKTIFDTKIRDVWEIKADQIAIQHPAWESELTKTLSQFKKELGFSAQDELIPELHNFLIYEPGQFFKPHQDSEKCDGMVASLVIVLPGKHTGGDFVIDHKGSTRRIQASKDSGNSSCTFIGFYSDCHHEATPVESGYRMALTYNLVLKKNKMLEENVEKCASTYFELKRELNHYFDKNCDLNSLNRPEKNPKKLVYLLDHDYTEHGLSWDSLKGRDIETVKVLRDLAESLDLDIYLTLADVKENWGCDEDGSYCDDEDRTLVELYCSETSLAHWLDSQGKPVELKNINISNLEICWTKASDEFDPYESQYEGNMGNYGNTMDRWYHRAAIVLWRRDEKFAVLNHIDSEMLMKILNDLIKDIQQDNQEKNKIKVLEIIQEFLPSWKGLKAKNSGYFSGEAEIQLFQIASYVQDAQIAQKLLAFMTISDINIYTKNDILNLSENYGVPWCLDQFQSWTHNPKSSWVGCKEQELSYFSDLILFFYSDSYSEKSKIAQWLLDYQWNFIQKIDLDFLKNKPAMRSLRDSTPSRCLKIYDYLKATVFAKDLKRHKEALGYIKNTAVLYPPLAIFHVFKAHDFQYQLDEWGHEDFFAFLFHVFQEEKYKGPKDPNDWGISESSTCDCEDCKRLNLFFKNKDQKAIFWSLAEKRRKHLVYKIEEACALVAHQVESTGSPYKLILTKKPKIHTEAEKRFAQVLEALKQLETMDVCVSF